MSLAPKLVVASLALGSGLPVAARAQNPWPVPVEDALLASLIDEALSRNPGLAAAKEAAVAAQSRPAQARSLPNPMVAVGYTNDGWSPSLGGREMTTLAFTASQELPYAGKRGLRGDISFREARQVEQHAERVRRSITAAVKRAYYGLSLSRSLLDLIQDQAEVWKQIEGVALARYAVGQGAQHDVLRVQVEVTRIEQLRAEEEAEAYIRLAELNRLLARAADEPLETTADLRLRPVSAGLDQVLEWVTRVSPELNGASLGVERASLGVALAKKEFKPDFSVQTVYMNRGGLAPMWQAGVGVSLPVHRQRLAAGLAEAEAELRSSEHVRDSVRLELRLWAQEQLTQLKLTERIAALYGDGIVPQDRMSLEAALANYQTGNIPFVAVLEALTTLYDDAATHLRQVARHEEILANIEEANLESGPARSTAGARRMEAAGGSSLRAAGSQGMGRP